MNTDDETLKNKIIECLKPIDPAMVILFGSRAWSSKKQNSDIDLYVVTKDLDMPNSFADKMRIKSKVSKRLLELKKQFGADLIVHTIPMHQRFIKMNSSFARKIMQQGKILI
jgi:predicted nucleotidyltransferase